MYTLKASNGSPINLEKMLKNIRQGSPDDYQKILDGIDQLKIDPRPDGCKKIRPRHAHRYRIRCGNYRVVYSIDDQRQLVYILAIDHRKNVYKHLM